MMIDPTDPAHHEKTLWVVHGPTCQPSIVCAQLRAYSADFNLLPVGQAGDHVCIWGYSVYKRVPGFRTLGIRLSKFEGEHKARYYTEQEEALSYLRKITKPRAAR